MELTGEENIYQHAQVMGLSKEEIESKKQSHLFLLLNLILLVH